MVWRKDDIRVIRDVFQAGYFYPHHRSAGQKRTPQPCAFPVKTALPIFIFYEQDRYAGNRMYDHAVKES